MAGKRTSKLLFGTAGFPKAAENKGVFSALKTVSDLGLDGMEMAFVRSVWLSDEKAQAVKDDNHSLFLTAHAPYYVNLNSNEPEKRVQSRTRIIRAARTLLLAGGQNIVFHPGFYMGRPSEEVCKIISKEIKLILNELDDAEIILRPETTGKASQFGSLSEILYLCQEHEAVKPCIDFSHLYTRSLGETNDYESFIAVLDQVQSRLGKSALSELHIHVSGICYGKKGEKKHLTLAESDFNYKDLLKALSDQNCSGTLICESTNLEEDALHMKSYYNNL